MLYTLLSPPVKVESTLKNSFFFLIGFFVLLPIKIPCSVTINDEYTSSILTAREGWSTNARDEIII